MSVDSLGLDPVMADRFWTFHGENPHVYEAFCKLAQQAIQAGAERSSADLICHVIRWNRQLATSGFDFKINNCFTAYYARLWLRDHPEHPRFFELRGVMRYQPERPVMRKACQDYFHAECIGCGCPCHASGIFVALLLDANRIVGMAVERLDQLACPSCGVIHPRVGMATFNVDTETYETVTLQHCSRTWDVKPIAEITVTREPTSEAGSVEAPRWFNGAGEEGA